MNLKTIFVALGLATAGLSASTPAQAEWRGYYDGYGDRYYGDRHYRDRYYGDRYDRWDRRDHRRDWKHRKHWREHHARRYYGRNDRYRDCWREWHRGRRVTVCNYW